MTIHSLSYVLNALFVAVENGLFTFVDPSLYQLDSEGLVKSSASWYIWNELTLFRSPARERMIHAGFSARAFQDLSNKAFIPDKITDSGHMCLLRASKAVSSLTEG